MRILHTSDWHLGKSLHDFSLLEDQRHFVDWLLELLEAREIDAVVIAGDIYDRPVPSGRAVELYDHFLSRAVGHMGIPVLAVAGNHDSASRLEFGSSLYRAAGYHICGRVTREIRRVTLEDGDGPVHFHLLPYLHPAEVRVLFGGESVRTFDDAYRVLLEHNPPGAGGRHIAVAHGFFSRLGEHAENKELLTSDSEINLGGIDIADSGYFAPYQYVALGHLHAPQRAGGNGIRYSGSPLKYSLSEEHQGKSVILVELDGDDVRTETIPVEPLRNLRTIRGEFDQLLDPSFHQNRRFDDYVFAEIAGESVLYPMEKLRTLFPHLLGLRFLSHNQGQVPQITLNTGTTRLSAEELFCRFYREIKGHDIPPEHLELVRELLEEEREEAHTT